MIRTLVVDDEWYNREEIGDLLEKTGITVVSRCSNGAEALEAAARFSPQAAFIDIEMPEMDGLTLAEKLLELYPAIKIIFITGWNQYAVAAFELNALDYIMKPVNKSRFDKMAERLKSEIGSDVPGKTLQIRCFGRFEVRADGKPVVWQRTKAEELFAFLLDNHDVFVHKDIILENLWPEHERNKALPILQTSVCKIRNVFSVYKNEVKLTYADNKYGLFLTNVDCEYDDVESALSGFDKDRSETFGAVEAACALCQRGYLAQNSYLWSAYKDEEIRKSLCAAIKEIAREYRNQLLADKELGALERLARLSPADEGDQLLYLNALKARGLKGEIVRYCGELQETLHADYDTALPETIAGLLKECEAESVNVKSH